MRAVQNRVIGRMIDFREQILRTSDTFPFEYQVVGDMRDLVAKPYERREDVWMRYRVHEDVRDWAEFLRPLLPVRFEKFLRAGRPAARRRRT